MRLSTLFLGVASAIDCEMFNLTGFDTDNGISWLSSTPPTTTNKSVYFNPCSPLRNVSECGLSHYCEIDRIEINGEWSTVAVKQFLVNNTEESVWSFQPEFLMILYSSVWANHPISGSLQFFCSTEESIDVDAELDYVTVNTPSVCHLGVPVCEPHRRHHPWWKFVGKLLLFFVVVLGVYVGIALYAASKNRELGPLGGEIILTLQELPQLVTGLVLSVYERVTGRGTGRNRI